MILKVIIVAIYIFTNKETCSVPAGNSAEPSKINIDTLLYAYGNDGFGIMNRELGNKPYYLPVETSNLTRVPYTSSP